MEWAWEVGRGALRSKCGARRGVAASRGEGHDRPSPVARRPSPVARRPSPVARRPSPVLSRCRARFGASPELSHRLHHPRHPVLPAHVFP
ncbi:hypothetical protein F3K43_40880 [Streptomyces sp. LBUM 1476]|nr:hypothetical protein [Streptomyces sp. LBUM 1476]